MCTKILVKLCRTPRRPPDSPCHTPISSGAFVLLFGNEKSPKTIYVKLYTRTENSIKISRLQMVFRTLQFWRPAPQSTMQRHIQKIQGPLRIIHLFQAKSTSKIPARIHSPRPLTVLRSAMRLAGSEDFGVEFSHQRKRITAGGEIETPFGLHLKDKSCAAQGLWPHGLSQENWSCFY